MLTSENVKSIYELLCSLAQPNRMRILEILHKHTELNVADLCGIIQLDQGLVSHHLRVLTQCKLLEMRKSGKNTFYSINYIRWAQVRSAVGDLASD
ncbi:MAG: ArsR/SmtB family transcription factor [Bacteroidia bacterium]